MSFYCKKISWFLVITAFSVFTSCAKLVKIPEPINTITNQETFSSDATATSAIVGIYNDLLTGNSGNSYNLSFANGLITIDAGMSSDELSSMDGNSAFETNTLNSSDFPESNFWDGPYLDIYLANAIVENLTISTGVSPGVRNQLMGEAKFLRAYCYFYLVNLFGDVPLTTTTAYAHNDTLHRTPVPMVYQQIIADLKAARQLLPDDYAISGSARVRANRSCANALLARAWLFQQQWDSAESAASAVIGNRSLYGLSGDLSSVFLINSPEAILQWQIPDIYPYANIEANTFIPYDSTSRPNYYLADSLLASFEPGDKRRQLWVDSTDYSGKFYFFPGKYKVRQGMQGGVTENYVVLRLAELYLIRAEARAHQNNLNGAIVDLDSIRERAGLGDLSAGLGQTGILAAVMQERRIEMFAEWGHRWLDLKRTGQADAVLTQIKPNWKPAAKLYPIPAPELVNDGNLVQNPGY